MADPTPTALACVSPAMDKPACLSPNAIGDSQTALPPGFRVLNDGPGREVLVDDRTDDPAPVFATVDEAAATAWTWWREIYEPELLS